MPTEPKRIIDQLSSRSGLRTQDGNVRVANRCISDPALLETVVEQLEDDDVRLIGDCAEVLTKVAEQAPSIVSPHRRALLRLLDHRATRVRWEAAHALALIAPLVRPYIGRVLARLDELLRNDKSVIVRDYLLDAIGAYGGGSAKAAAAALPLLNEGLHGWQAKHAARVLRHLKTLVATRPSLAGEISAMAAPLAKDSRAGVRRAVARLLAACRADDAPGVP